MKRIVVALLLLAAGMSAFAQGNFLEWNKLGLIPTPQKVELLRGSYYEKQICVLQKAKVVEQKVDTLSVDANLDQAYQIDFCPKKIILKYVGEAGRQNAYLTLEQLKQLHKWIHCITITDWPAYRYRGWMDDISRGPVPHNAYRQRQWETLHALKFNFCNYYTEHTLYQPEFPDLAPAYAAECKPHPDEVINLQLFAHAEKTLRIPFYQYMMDSKTNFDPSEEQTYDFLNKRIAAAYDRIPDSPFFIINCDETEQLGTGHAKHLVDSLGADQVYVNFINRCYQMVKKFGNPRVAMWGDIVAKNPAMMKQLPKDMIYIMWAYEPIDSFKHLIKPFKEQGNPFWVAASTGHSGTMTSTPQRYMKNIANLFRDGNRDGAVGAMLTCWDDNGEALFDNSWHAHFWAAEMAWNPLKSDDPNELKEREAIFNYNYARLFYGDTSDRPLNALYKVGSLMYNPVSADLYISSALLRPLLNITPADLRRANSQLRDTIASVEKYVDSATNPHEHYALMRMKASSSKLGLQQAIDRQLKSGNHTEECQTLANNYFRQLKQLKNEYLRLWDQENGDYERYIVMNRYDNMAKEVLELDRHVFMETSSTSVSSSTSSTSFTSFTSATSSASATSSTSFSSSSRPLVSLRTLYNDRPIYYTLDGSEPTKGSTLYNGPFPLELSTTIKAISYNKYGEGVITEQYLVSHLGMGAKLTLQTAYSSYKDIYSGGGDNALIDGQLGSNTTYADGHWQGYWGDSIDAIIDFGEPKEIHQVSMRFMQNTFDWILAPWDIILYVSDNGKDWTIQLNHPFIFDSRETGMRLRHCTLDIFKGVRTRYLRVVVPNPGPLPSWHPAPGQPSYLFTDEIIIN